MFRKEAWNELLFIILTDILKYNVVFDYIVLPSILIPFETKLLVFISRIIIFSPTVIRLYLK